MLASSRKVASSSTTSKPSLVTLKHCFLPVMKSSLLPSFSGYGSFLHAWQRNVMGQFYLLNFSAVFSTIVSCDRQQYYNGLSQKLLLYPHPLLFWLSCLYGHQTQCLFCYWHFLTVLQSGICSWQCPQMSYCHHVSYLPSSYHL